MELRKIGVEEEGEGMGRVEGRGRKEGRRRGREGEGRGERMKGTGPGRGERKGETERGSLREGMGARKEGFERRDSARLENMSLPYSCTVLTLRELGTATATLLWNAWPTYQLSCIIANLRSLWSWSNCCQLVAEFLQK
jgi:hypothetical protein